MVVDGVLFDVEVRAGDDVAELVVARRKLRERDVGLPDAVEVAIRRGMAVVDKIAVGFGDMA